MNYLRIASLQLRHAIINLSKVDHIKVKQIINNLKEEEDNLDTLIMNLEYEEENIKWINKK